ncbi:hypothetical protein VHEMI06485 [[Torrubiella] hemipterigena]|uniref:Borealin N-terminal domain-containing protein n=1 Tax=[Torrubiella] hemipterigena TaxID=1531966 RepID=A0A0A1T7G2_9HYPO|nr:hypothetical protein VHEMI06485 [[Torrubiella] hemipterigena]
MAPTKSKKLVSDQKSKSRMATKVPIRDSPSTPQRSPIKRRKIGISLQQKQTLIDNLQLEVTERARRLRAQYHAHAQGIRSRIEMRINRIPTSLRKMTMGELLMKFIQQEQQKAANVAPPPVPAKDYPTRTQPKKTAQAHHQKRLSHEISGDKENANENGEHLKKRVRGAQMGSVRPTQVLSPTSSNSRLAHRETSPRKAPLSRPGSPLKGNGQSRSATAINALTNMVEKAKAARAAGSRKATTTSTSRPATAMSNKTRPVTTSRNQPSRPPTRVGRRLSNASDTSQSSTTTVVRKPTGTKATASSARKAITSSVRKATTSTKTSGTLQTSSSGRILRKRA